MVKFSEFRESKGHGLTAGSEINKFEGLTVHSHDEVQEDNYDDFSTISKALATKDLTVLINDEDGLDMSMMDALKGDKVKDKSKLKGDRNFMHQVLSIDNHNFAFVAWDNSYYQLVIKTSDLSKLLPVLNSL